MPSSRHARWLQETQRGQVVLERDGKGSKMSMPCRTNIIIFFLYYGKWRMDYRQAMGTGLFVPFGSRKKITSLNRCLAWSDKVNTLVNKFSNIVYPYSLARPSPSTPITLDRNAILKGCKLFKYLNCISHRCRHQQRHKLKLQKSL